MKKLLICCLSLFASDQEYLDLVEKIKAHEFPPLDYSISVDEIPIDEITNRICPEFPSQKSEFFGDEAEFHPEILINPLQELGIQSSESVPHQIEIILEPCEESGTFERQFLQTRKVTLLEEPTQVKKCDGHREIREKSTKGKSEKEQKVLIKNTIKKLQNELNDNPAIAQNFQVTSETHKYHVDFILEYRHLDDTALCNHSHLVTVQNTLTEKESWEVDAPEEYESIKNNPSCKLSLVSIKDASSRILLFQCAPDKDSPCHRLRELGGQLIKKQCIRENEETGQCEFWKCIYDLGKKRQPHTTFEGKKIWGMDWKEIDPHSLESDKESQFSQVHGILQSLSQMPMGEGDNLFHSDTQKVFNGTVHHCRCNHNIKELQECCKKMSGLIILGIWSPCSEEEIELKKMKDEGRCHYIGSYLDKGIVDIRHRTYCCFPTKLLRIFHEQTKKQMGAGWGTAKKPDCRGFSLEEIEAKGDMSLLDFSEGNDELAIDEEALKKEMQDRMQSAKELLQPYD